MARKGHGRPANLVQIAGSGTTYPDDGSSPVGSNEWNANRDTVGVIGFTKKTEAIASYAINVTDSFIEVTNAGEIRTMNQVATALSTDYYPSDTSTKSFAEGDLLYLVKATAGHTITLKHQYGSSGGAGKITTLTGGDLLLDVNVPRIFICRTISGVQEWIEYGGGTASDLDTTNFAAATLVIESEGISSNDNDTTIPTSAAVKDYVDSTPVGDITSVVAGSGLTGGGTTADVTLNVIGGTGITANADEITIDATVATLVGSQILTNKTVDLGDNTVTGTIAEFNTALQSESFATLGGTETLASKTLSAPTLTGTTIAATLDISGDVDVDGTLETDALTINGTTLAATIVATKVDDLTAGDDNTDIDASSAKHGLMPKADSIKLAAIETAADVTDATNVNAAGAVMVSDASTAGMGFVIDEDAMGSNSDTKVPTQQSVITYVASQLTSDIALKGDYNASTNSPDLDSSPSGIKLGDHYVVSVAGSLYAEALQAGDSIIAKRDNPTEIAHWITINNNIVAGTILRANLEADIINGDKLADDAVAAEHLASDAVVNASVAAGAVIAYSKLAALSDGNILVGSSGGVATSVNPSGDIDVSNTGAFSIASGVVLNADVNAGAAIDYSKLATLADGNILVGSSGGVATSVNPSGDVDVSNVGAFTIQAGAVDIAMIANPAGGTAGNTTFLRGDGSWQAISSGFVATATDDLNFAGDYDIEDVQRIMFEVQGTGFTLNATNNENSVDNSEQQMFIRAIDPNNEGLFVRLKKNGASSYEEVQLA